MADIFKINVGGTEYEILDASTLKIISDNVEDSSTASRTYNAGEFILKNKKLYKVTTTIASGGTFTEGVNIEETTIGEELTAIKSDLTDSVTIDHTGKTIGQLLKALYDSIDRAKLTAKAVVKLGTNVFVATSIQNDLVSFTNVAINANNVRTITLLCTADASTCYEQMYVGSTGTYSTYQAESATDDITLYY